LKDKKSKEEGTTDMLMREHRRAIYLVVGLLVVAAALYLYVGFPRDSYQACSSIAYTNQKVSCLDALAYSSENISICRSVPGSDAQGLCMSRVAEKLGNVGACNEMSHGSSYFVGCIENLSESGKNISGCTALNGSLEYQCSLDVITSVGYSNLNDCSAIQNGTFEEECTSLYYYSKAQSSRQPSYCGQIVYSDNATVSDIIQQSGPELAGYYPILAYSLNLTAGDYCYMNLAYETMNQSICASVGGYGSTQCQSLVATESTNSSAAKSNYSASNLTSACGYAKGNVSQICDYALTIASAVSEKNVTKCSSVNSTPLQYSCITTIADDYNDSQYCSYINNSTFRQGCLISIYNESG
jgi:hypothetical protein